MLHFQKLFQTRNITKYGDITAFRLTKISRETLLQHGITRRWSIVVCEQKSEKIYVQSTYRHTGWPKMRLVVAYVLEARHSH